MTRPSALAAWHRIVETRDAGLLDGLLADDCVFRSPAVHSPQEGKALTTAYLQAALAILGPTLRYREEWVNDDSAVLEFEAEVPSTGSGRATLELHGIDLLRWGTDGRLTSFTVMVRPMRGLEALIGSMGAELGRAARG